MTATDLRTYELVKALKANRRAELKAAEDKAKADAALAEEQAKAEFLAAVDTGLRAFDAEWLRPYYVGIDGPQNDRGNGLTYQQARFRIPGHYSIALVLVRKGTFAPWRFARRNDEETPPWQATINDRGSDYFDELADALIAAEIDPDAPPPIPF